jgi:hypothetical protein
MSPRKVNLADASTKFDNLSLDTDAADDFDLVEGDGVTATEGDEFFCSLCQRSFESEGKLQRHLEFSTIHSLNMLPPPPVAPVTAPALPAPVQSKYDVEVVGTKEVSFFVSGLQDLVNVNVSIYEIPALRVYVVRAYLTQGPEVSVFPYFIESFIV